MEPKETESYRHELKYLISQGQLQLARARLAPLMRPDPHAGPEGMYRIRSLYFDDRYDTCLRENLDGTDPREKFRVRIYNHSTQRIRLECKEKRRGMTRKTACPLTEAQTRLLMAGIPPGDLENQPPLLRRLTVQMMTRGVRPVVIVEYDRIPYVYPLGNVRVTLDTGISSCRAVDRFLDETLPRRPVLPIGQELLEVKYDGFLPDFLHRSLQMPDLRQTAFSKYAICRSYTR